ncbi:helix-turn-helix domain-containing protein [Pectinatus brassicae]|uniref:Helix-turn-helix domain-containing protein n=1 Tax=Pectinatus brassicae TaxID=862415 RepID=A0A840UTZ8_9FIRM|nr:helix-turn-helix domain-containing protein [Pectinatus brassicae]MBB5337602.1 hypothetical protein [Pectinatus brassicae]
MTKIKVSHNKNYTIMSNYHLRDKKLSLKAKGLMSYMLSLPDNWDYSVSGLSIVCNCGRDAIRTGLNELEKQGYLKRVQQKENGKFDKTIYILHEEKQK